MNTLKTLILALVFVINSAVAEEITILYANPFGGGMDRTTEAIKEILTASGHTVTRKNFKSYVTALDTIKSSPKNSFLITFNGDLYLDGKTGTMNCPPVDLNLNLVVYSSIIASPFYLTTIPGFNGTSVEKLREISKTRKVILSTVVSATSSGALELFAKRNLEKYAVLNFASAAEMRAAITSSEVDVVLGSFFTKELVSKGGTTIAVTSNTYVTPEIKYMGDPDFLSGYTFMHIKNSSTPAVDKAMLIAMGSPELVKIANGVGGKIHGLVSGISAKETADQLLMLGRAYGQ